MKNIKKQKGLVLSLTLVGAMLFGSSMAFADDQYGSTGALNESETITLEEMLVYAIQDEYAALAEYELIMDEFDVTTPFSNIARSELTHISWLEPLFDAYGFEIPENTASDHVILPSTLLEAYETGVQAEILNIDMYEKFLETDLPSDVEVVFEALMNASENHLASFERQVDRHTSFPTLFNRSGSNFARGGMRTR